MYTPALVTGKGLGELYLPNNAKTHLNHARYRYDKPADVKDFIKKNIAGGRDNKSLEFE
jgi:hypothetical protein